MSKQVLSSQFITNADLGSSYNSDPIKLSMAKSSNIQLLFTGAPVGTFKLQTSTDTTNKASEVTNWDDVPDSDQAVSAAGSHTWITNLRLKWVRVVFTRTSGNGTLNGNYFAVEEH